MVMVGVSAVTVGQLFYQCEDPLIKVAVSKSQLTGACKWGMYVYLIMSPRVIQATHTTFHTSITLRRKCVCTHQRGSGCSNINGKYKKDFNIHVHYALA